MSKELLERAFMMVGHALPAELQHQIIAELAKDVGCADHEIADASNAHVESGYYCVKCGQLFKAAEVKTEPAAWQHPVSGANILNYKKIPGITLDDFTISLYDMPTELAKFDTLKECEGTPGWGELDALEKLRLLCPHAFNNADWMASESLFTAVGNDLKKPEAKPQPQPQPQPQTKRLSEERIKELVVSRFDYGSSALRDLVKAVEQEVLNLNGLGE